MSSRHAMQGPKTARAGILVLAAMVAVAIVAISAAVLARLVTDGHPTVVRQATSAAVAAPQIISQEGRIVAVTATSVTALSVDGFARTYRIDSQTNAITIAGSLIGGTGTTFAVNDEVAIVGVVRDGTAVATAVAQKQVSDLNGPPMDGV